MDTAGYGGRKIVEQAKIYTNDKKRPLLIVTLTGYVEQFVTISPKWVRLVGPLGKTIVTHVTIKKRPQYPFKIVGLRALKGKFIRYTLEALNDSSQPGYVLTVECTKKTKGRFADTIYLKTDSKIRPEISINVIGNIYDG